MGAVSAEAGLADGHGDEIDLPGAGAGGVEVADDDIAIRGAEEVAHVSVRCRREAVAAGCTGRRQPRGLPPRACAYRV